MALRIPLILLLALGLTACGGDEEAGPGDGPAPETTPANPQASPKAVADAIFAAARSGNYGGLAALVDPVDADGDTKRLAEVMDGGESRHAEFKKWFGKGKVAGEVTIEGDTAEVPITFGPDGTKPQTFNMVRRDGKWYLQSF